MRRGPYAPQTNGNPRMCDLGEYPNGNPSDAEMSVTSHERQESITDPFGTVWWDSNRDDGAYGQENGSARGRLSVSSAVQWRRNSS